jgi:mono/diheme cytochrome c family protein/DNA-binding beta-propeller fold protein YncE
MTMPAPSERIRSSRASSLALRQAQGEVRGRGADAFWYGQPHKALILSLSKDEGRRRSPSPRRATLTLALLGGLAAGSAVAAEPVSQDQARALYNMHCAVCHSSDRLGGRGPALLPENLRRLRKKRAVGVIARGRPATQMPAFGKVISKAEIAAIVKLIYTEPKVAPRWTLKQIKASHVVNAKVLLLPAKPVFKADPLNLFVVVESGDHHVTILDGDSFTPIHRFGSRFALHGGPKFSPTGRFVYFGSRDGWVTKFDLWNLKTVAEIRAGINTRNIAVSSDGKWVMVGNYLPHTLVILHARDLTPFRVVKVADRKGVSSRVSAVYDAAPRKSFVVALKDVKELWEMSYDPKAKPVYEGLVHSYRKGHVEGIVAEKQPFARRRIRLESYFDDFFFSPDYSQVFGAARGGKTGGAVYNLNVRRKIADLELDGLPHLGSGITWKWQGRRVMATPHLRTGTVSIIDMESWKTIKRIKTLGPGFFMRSHEKSRYAFVDVFFGPHRDVVHVIDKQTLKIVKDLRPAPGKTAAHVEFTRDGRYALVSVWHMDGAIVVYDARTLKEVKRVPMRKPSGKYNVHNKITRSEGTSH